MTRRLFVDANRCIGCGACEAACGECPGHGGESMIHLDHLRRAATVQTAPTVCMHCLEPACVSVCPADAIPVDESGVVLTAAPERCIGCGNCALACPFGVPRVSAAAELMRKCDLCYDRTAVGLTPMCALVCPSGALFYGTSEEIEDLRRARPLGRFLVGDHTLETRNHVMAPAGSAALVLGAAPTALRSRAEAQLEEALA